MFVIHSVGEPSALPALIFVDARLVHVRFLFFHSKNSKRSRRPIKVIREVIRQITTNALRQ